LAKKREIAGIGAPLKLEKKKTDVSEKKSESKEPSIVSIFLIIFLFLGNGFIEKNGKK